MCGPSITMDQVRLMGQSVAEGTSEEDYQLGRIARVQSYYRDTSLGDSLRREFYRARNERQLELRPATVVDEAITVEVDPEVVAERVKELVAAAAAV